MHAVHHKLVRKTAQSLPFALFALSLLLISSASSRDPWQEMEKIAGAYMQAPYLSVSGSMYLYTEEDPPQFIEKQDFSYRRNKDVSRYRVGPVEFIYNDRYALQVDHEQQLVVLLRGKRGKKRHREIDLDALKKLMKSVGAEASVEDSGASRVLTVNNIPGEKIAGYSVYYAPDTYRIHKVIMHMHSLEDAGDDAAGGGPALHYYRLEVIYTGFASGPAVKTADPVKKYISVDKDGNVQLNPAYSDYELIK